MRKMALAAGAAALLVASSGPSTGSGGAELAALFIQVGMQLADDRAEREIERDRLRVMGRISDNLASLHVRTANIETLIRSDRVRQFYVSTRSLNGRVNSLAKNYLDRGSVDKRRLDELRAEADKLAFEAGPVHEVSAEYGMQYLLALRSVVVVTGLLEALEGEWGTIQENAARYASMRAELAGVVATLDRRQRELERDLPALQSNYRAAIRGLRSDVILVPLAQSLETGRRSVEHCVESRSSTFERQTDVDVCIGTQTNPVMIKSRRNRETGEEMPGRLTYGCVRYVRESRAYDINPTFWDGRLVGASLQYLRGGVTYHPTSDAYACPVQREGYEPQQDWGQIEAKWSEALATVFAIGGDSALITARRRVISDIQRLNRMISV